MFLATNRILVKMQKFGPSQETQNSPHHPPHTGLCVFVCVCASVEVLELIYLY